MQQINLSTLQTKHKSVNPTLMTIVVWNGKDI